MAKLLHFADLHIKRDEKDYCYSVLEDIVAAAKERDAKFIAVSGDLFDSYADFEALRREVAERFAPLVRNGCHVLYIPGNHEARGASADLSAFNLDPVRFCARGPFDFFELEGVEFLCVPHAESYDGYRDWKVPRKQNGATRVALVHALNSTIYTGPDEEADSKTGVIEDDFFRRFEIDYAAMGHVHSGRQQLLGGAVVCYPGSARVWRAHPREAGPRNAVAADLSCLPVVAHNVELKSAGQYREYELPVDLKGAAPLPAVHRVEDALGGRDHVRVKLTGVVEDENAAREAADALRQRLGNKARTAEVELDTIPASSLSSNSLAKAFIERMEEIKPGAEEGPDFRRWLLARQYGLEEIAARSGEAA
ncbi:MAG: metallophosphoesterase [Elusimicrobia bacterium]|nr:metallophosphoesterase [Elusimicrobiota bacterium]